ncbi:hypothetical protein VCRA217O166_250031 [Vibrio crassostreae]|nr:hypothetical protein VCRA2119O245_230032 [Vibrio crassostreae]CAK3831964.1 hypothetical protein VCRA217O166_250031 [Vibrio crassostreae]
MKFHYESMSVINQDAKQWEFKGEWLCGGRLNEIGLTAPRLRCAEALSPNLPKRRKLSSVGPTATGKAGQPKLHYSVLLVKGYLFQSHCTKCTMQKHCKCHGAYWQRFKQQNWINTKGQRQIVTLALSL